MENHKKTPWLSSCYYSFLVIAILFTLYEWTIIGNPFFDPIQASWLWALLALGSISFLFRLVQAKR